MKLDELDVPEPSDGWQETYDPDNPLAMLEKAAAAGETEQGQAAVRAVRAMLAAGADVGVLDAARGFIKRHKLLSSIASFDALVRDARGGTADHEPTSAATMLVQLAQEFYTFGVSDTSEPFAIPNDGPKVVAMLRGGKTSLRALLAREYFTRTGRAATQQALADALLVIEGIAQDADESRLFLRAAQHERRAVARPRQTRPDARPGSRLRLDYRGFGPGAVQADRR